MKGETGEILRALEKWNII